jgi:hypothetical protein
MLIMGLTIALFFIAPLMGTFMYKLAVHFHPRTYP